MSSRVHQYYWSLIPNFFQDAELNQAEEASSSHPVALEEPLSTPSSSSVEAADVPPAAEEQTSDQPAETQTEAQSSSSPIDLSTKKTPEPDSTTWTAAAAPTATTTGQGVYHFLFVATVVWVSSETLHLRKSRLCSNVPASFINKSLQPLEDQNYQTQITSQSNDRSAFIYCLRWIYTVFMLLSAVVLQIEMRGIRNSTSTSIYW